MSATANSPPQLTFGPFGVTRDGKLVPRDPAVRPALRFAWRGRRCEALIHGHNLQLTAVAGRIPSTAERGADREQTMREVAGLPAELPEGWKLQLTANHSVAIAVDMPPGETAVSMLSQLVRFALALDPYLDWLEAAGAAHRAN